MMGSGESKMAIIPWSGYLHLIDIRHHRQPQDRCTGPRIAVDARPADPHHMIPEPVVDFSVVPLFLEHARQFRLPRHPPARCKLALSRSGIYMRL